MNKKLHNMQQRENGFTLIELLIVVLIVGILAAIAIPVYLGIQAGGHKSAVRSDVNIKVKTIQASLTEGATVSQFLGTINGTETGETIQVKASTTTGAAANDFMVIGSESTTGSPAAAIDYTYTYDSVTGNFTDSDTSNVALGSSNIAKTYAYTFEDGTVQGWTGAVSAPNGSTANTNLAPASNVNGHPAVLSVSGLLTNNNNNRFTATIYPAGTDATLTVGKQYKLTYAYYMVDAYGDYTGKYVTNTTMSAGNNNAAASGITKGSWATATVTWTQSVASDPYKLTFTSTGYNGAYNKLFLDDISIQQLN